MSEYEALVRVIQQSGARIQSQYVVDAPDTPNLYLAHLTLDGREFVIAVFPTDLRDAGRREEEA